MALRAGPYGPSSPASIQDPREADDTRPPRERLHKAGSRGAERSRQGKTSRGPNDVSHDDQGQEGASRRRVLISSLVLKEQVQARSPEASGKGFHIGATRPRPAGRQDGGHYGAQDGVTTRAFGRRRPPFVRIACTCCPPLNWPLWDSSPPDIWEEDPVHYK